MNNDRIRLAEAMEWHKNPDSGSWVNRINFPDVKYAHYEHELPDPFTDANDDYAVLEWIRKDGLMPMSMYEKQQFHYQIGDYARAALKAIEDDKR